MYVSALAKPHTWHEVKRIYVTHKHRDVQALHSFARKKGEVIRFDNVVL